MLMDTAAPWDFDSELASETVLIGKEEYPDVKIQSVESHDVTKMTVQLIRVQDTVTGEDCIMRRVVGQLSNGTEVDIGERFAVPTVLVNSKVDMSRCEACLERIEPSDNLVIYEGKAYHKWCMEDDE
jgi:hypothetical protein